MGAIKDVALGIPARIIPDTLSSIAQVFDDPETSNGILDPFIEWNRNKQNEYINGPGGDEEIFPGLNVTRREMREGVSSLGFSVTAMGAAFAPRLIGGATGGVAGFVAGSAASGAAAYRMDRNGFIREYREFLNQKEGRQVTDQEFAQMLPGKTADLLREHGLHEAGWEGIANAVESGIMARLAAGGLTTKALKGLLGFVMFELGSEAATQIGQTNVEVKLGMRPEDDMRSFASPQDWMVSAREVLPAIMLMSGTMGGASYAVGKYRDKKSAMAMADLKEQGFSIEELEALKQDPEALKQYKGLRPEDITGLQEELYQEEFDSIEAEKEAEMFPEKDHLNELEAKIKNLSAFKKPNDRQKQKLAEYQAEYDGLMAGAAKKVQGMEEQPQEPGPATLETQPLPEDKTIVEQPPTPGSGEMVPGAKVEPPAKEANPEQAPVPADQEADLFDTNMDMEELQALGDDLEASLAEIEKDLDAQMSMAKEELPQGTTGKTAEELKVEYEAGQDPSGTKSGPSQDQDGTKPGEDDLPDIPYKDETLTTGDESLSGKDAQTIDTLDEEAQADPGTKSAPSRHQVLEVETRISNGLLDKAKQNNMRYGEKSLTPLAVDIAQDAIDTRDRMTKEKRVALAEKYGVPENVVHQMTTGGPGYETLAGQRESGDKEVSTFLSKPLTPVIDNSDGETAEASPKEDAKPAELPKGSLVEWETKKGDPLSGTLQEKHKSGSWWVARADGKKVLVSEKSLKPVDVVPQSEEPIADKKLPPEKASHEMSGDGFKTYSYKVSGEPRKVIEHPNGSKLIQGKDSNGDTYYEFEGDFKDFDKYVDSSDGLLSFNEQAIKELFQRKGLSNKAQPIEQNSVKQPSNKEPEQKQTSPWPESFAAPTESHKDVKKTMTGRDTTPFPKLNMATSRTVNNSVKKHHAWLIKNAIEEAKARGDQTNLRMFNTQMGQKLSPADVDTAQGYLFDWEVQKQPAPITTPLKTEGHGNLAQELMDKDKTLTARLKDEGYTTRSEKGGRKFITKDGEDVFLGTASQVSKWLDDGAPSTAPKAPKTEDVITTPPSDTPVNTVDKSEKDAAPKKKKKSSALGDQLKAEWAKQAKAKKEEEARGRDEKAAELKERMSHAADNVKDSASKMMDAFKNINDILGDRGSFSTEEADENIYQQIKEQLNIAWGHAQETGRSITEFVTVAMEALSHKASPYFERWVDEEIEGNTDAEDQDQDHEGRQDVQGVDIEGDSPVRGGRGRTVASEGEHTTPEDPGGSVATQPTEDVSETQSPGDTERDGIRSGVQDDGSRGTDVEGRDAPDGRTSTSGSNVVADGSGGARGRRLGNYHIDDPKKLIGGTPKKRFAKNKSAIETFNKVMNDGRHPTAEERDAIAGYIGWGSFGQDLFQGSWKAPIYKDGWQKENDWLREHLGESAWRSAQASIINAHYTDPPTVSAIWEIARKLGFKGGRVLEPSMGIGNFFGLMPKDFKSKSDLTGIELDETTADMARMLYPNANVQQMGYEKSATADGFYDLVVGNWPFAADGPATRRYDKYALSLHDFFFVKALDQVRPGGLVIGITSSGTMDKKGTVARTQMEKRGKLIAAYRMPMGAFKEYAGTSVVADILVFQKHPDGKISEPTSPWKKQVPLKDSYGDGFVDPDGREITVNEYWDHNPKHVLGNMTVGHGTTQGRMGMIVERERGYGSKLDSLADNFPADIVTKRTNVDHIKYISNNTKERQNSITVTKDGDIYVVAGERLARLSDVVKYSVKNAKVTKDREAQVKSLVEIKKLYGNLLDTERTGGSNVEGIRANLNAAYKNFTNQWGSINGSYGLKVLQKVKDPLAPALEALENNTGTKKAPVYAPSKVLTESTQRTRKVLTNPSVTDAFVMARNEDARVVDLEGIAETTGKTVDDVKKELFDKDAIFETPSGLFEVKDIYLSGNVRVKLSEAQDAQKQGMDMARNIEALKKILPKDVPYFSIEVNLGATWIPSDVYRDFFKDSLNLPDGLADTIHLTPSNTGWSVKFDDNRMLNDREEVRSLWSPKRESGDIICDFTRVARAAFTGQLITIKARDLDGNEFTDTGASTIANEKVDEFREALKDWVWKDIDRRVALEKHYNEIMNAFASPEYDGSFLSFEGMMLNIGQDEFNLRMHQVNAIWRGVANGRGLYAHEVGTGKTFTMGGLAIESRRYGIAQKPLILAHNANSASVADDIQQMYPGSNLLYLDNLSPATIQSKLYQIANDDWDAVIMPHSLIDRLTLSEETLMRLAAEEIEALETAAIESAEEEGFDIAEILDDEEELNKVRGASTAKEIVKQRNKIIKNIQKQALASSREDAVPFEMLGIDMLIIDEAHEFKKPPLSTKMKVKGLNTATNNKSIALNFLTSYVKEMNSGKGVHIFTGTPITNTLNEIYNHMRYTMSDKMEDAGVLGWDAWFNTFASVNSDVERNAAGEYESVSRLSGFHNVSELRRFAGQYMDIVFAEDMPEFVPRETESGKTLHSEGLTEKEQLELLDGRTDTGPVKGRPYKKVINEVADMSPQQREILDSIIERSRSFKNASGRERREIMKSGDNRNPVLVETDAAKAGFDVRLYDKDLSDHPDNKINRAVRNITEIYNSHEKASQVVFMEKGYTDTAKRSRRNADGEKYKITVETFNAVKDLQAKLIAGGIPEHQIAVVTGKTTKKKRLAIADAVNKAEIRVVIGLTSTLGTGVNMQENLKAMHHLDAPWMPGELEQRNGRGWRQGNRWNTVLEFRYITNNIDARRWQVLAKKQKLIIDFLRAKDGMRSIEGDALDMNEGNELDDITASFAEAAGDSRILMIEKLKKDIEKLSKKKRLHDMGIVEAKQKLKKNKTKIPEIEKDASKVNSDIVNFETEKQKPFSITVGKKTYTNRKKANVALEKMFIKNHGKRIDNDDGSIVVGHFRGFDIVMEPRWAVAPEYFLDREGYYNVQPVMGSLDSIGRTMGKKAENLAQELEDKHRAVKRFEQVQHETFGQESALQNKEAMLESIQADMAAFPDAPPVWLTQGAPIGTLVYHEGKAYEVEGHRAGAEEFYVMAHKEGDTSAHEVFTYTEVKDINNLPIYEDLTPKTKDTRHPDIGAAGFGQQGLDKAELQEPMYSTATIPGQEVTLQDIQKMFPGQNVGLSPDKSVWVRLKNGAGCQINTVKRLSSGEYQFAIKSGKMGRGGEIAGKYVSNTITLSSDFADTGTLSHEVAHWLEDIGVITQADKIALDGKARALNREGQFKGPWNKDMAENRANLIAQVLADRKAYRGTLVGRIVQKVGDFLDALVNLGHSSTRQVARGMESGSIYSRETEGIEHKDTHYELRTKPEPKKTIKAYKLFKVKKKHPGKLFPLFVGAKDPVGMGLWHDAEIGPMNDKGKVKSTLGPLAFRPGWHGGDSPMATHIGESGDGSSKPQFRPADQVWTEVEMPNDVDWQTEANKRATLTKAGKPIARTAHITDQIPVDGSYRYKTNSNMTGSWIISGAMKINRILTDSEVAAINEELGTADLPRANGAEFDFEAYGFGESQAQYSTVEPKATVTKAEQKKSNKAWKEANDWAKAIFKPEKVKASDKKDLSAIERVMSILSHFKGLDATADKVIDLMLNKTSIKVEKETDLFSSTAGVRGEFDHFTDGILPLMKHKAKYAALNAYIMDRDINQKGWKIRKEDGGWIAQAVKGERIGDIYESEALAEQAAIEHEMAAYPGNDMEKEALKAYRNIVMNSFHHYYDEWLNIIEEAELNGEPIPKVVMETIEGSIEVDIRAALKIMGDRRGYYFPRIRQSGKFEVFASKEGDHSTREYFDSKVMASKRMSDLKAQGYTVSGLKKNTVIPEKMFEGIRDSMAEQAATSQVLSKIPIYKRSLSDLKFNGKLEGNRFILTGSIPFDPAFEKLMESLGGVYVDDMKLTAKGMAYTPQYVFRNPPQDIEKQLVEALFRNAGLNESVNEQFVSDFVQELANQIRSRGSRARMIPRSESTGTDVVKGYEEDLLTATAQLVAGAAGGFAKQTIAQKGYSMMMGMETTWEEFQAKHPGSRDLLKAQEQLKQMVISTPEEVATAGEKKKELAELRKLLFKKEFNSASEAKAILEKVEELQKGSRLKYTNSQQAQALRKEIGRLSAGIWKDYADLVNSSKIDPVKQENLHAELTDSMEDILRNDDAIDRAINKVRAATVFYFLAGRVSSAAINLTNLALGVPGVAKAAGLSFQAVGTNVAKSIKLYGQFKFGSQTLDPAHKALFQAIADKGLDQPKLNQEAFDTLQTKVGKGFDKMMNALMFGFSVTEQINRAATIAGLYKTLAGQAKVDLVNEDGNVNFDLLQRAKELSDDAHGVYERANKPGWMKGEKPAARMLQVPYIFMTFTHNYMLNMAKMGWRGIRDAEIKKPGTWMNDNAQGALWLAFAPTMFGVGSSLGASALITLIGKLMGSDDPEDDFYKYLDTNYGPMAERIARYGVMGIPEHGADLSGSLKMGIPDAGLGAFGSMCGDIWDGARNVTKGFYWRAAEDFSPAFVQNMFEAARKYDQGTTTYSGAPVFYEGKRIKHDELDALLEALSFRPTRSASKLNKLYADKKIKAKYQDMRSDIYMHLKGHFIKPPEKRNPADMMRIRGMVLAYNRRVRDKGVRGRGATYITDKSVKTALRSMSTKKSKR
ncbi:MAG: PLxRFG domain-containing protein [Desulfobacterium sp.]|nr:PLxRFG domain-containing protein [Desulfobacterium sp.]